MIPSTLKTGAAKVWGQRTTDDQYILVYNPDDVTYKRYPLVLVQGGDGRAFYDMRVVHGEYPLMRYPGRYKDFGPQYVRGLADGDPYDYARAKCLFPPSAEVETRLRIKPLQTDAQLEVELADGHDRRPFRLKISSNGHIYVQDGDYSADLGTYPAGEWMAIHIQCSQSRDEYSLSVNGNESKVMRLADAGAGPMQLISLRSGAWRGITVDPLRYNQEFNHSDSNLGPVDAGTDVPAVKPAIYLIDDVSVQEIPEK